MKPTTEQLKALVHPLRWAMYAIMEAEHHPQSPAALARTLDQPVNLIAYHMGILARNELVEAAGTRPKRGSTEHFYRPSYNVAVEYDGSPATHKVQKGQLVEIQPIRMKLTKSRRRGGWVPS